MSLPLILAFITFLGWGTGDLFTVYVTRKIGATLTTFWVFFFSAFLALIIFPFVPHEFSAITPKLLTFNIFLGILFISGNVLISESFRLSSAPLVGIIIQAFPAVVLVLSALIFKDVVTTKQITIITMIFFGVGLCTVDYKKILRSEKIIDRGVFLALLAMVFLSIYFTFSRILINSYGWYLPSLIATMCFPIIFIFMGFRGEKFVVPKEAKILIYVFLVGLLIRTGDFALNFGLSIPNASSIVAPIASAAPILFVVLSKFVYKDKLTRQQILGIVITLAGIIALSVV